MKVVFCTHNGDALGLRAIEILKEMGCETLILKEGEKVLPGDVAFFTAPPTINISGKHLRVASHRLSSIAPDWAKSTPLLIAIRQNPPILLNSENFSLAVQNIAQQCEDWFAAGLQGCPWSGSSPTREPHMSELEEWQSMVKELKKSIPGVPLEKTPSLHLTKTKLKKTSESWYRQRSHKRWFFLGGP